MCGRSVFFNKCLLLLLLSSVNLFPYVTSLQLRSRTSYGVCREILCSQPAQELASAVGFEVLKELTDDVGPKMKFLTNPCEGVQPNSMVFEHGMCKEQYTAGVCQEIVCVRRAVPRDSIVVTEECRCAVAGAKGPIISAPRGTAAGETILTDQSRYTASQLVMSTIARRSSPSLSNISRFDADLLSYPPSLLTDALFFNYRQSPFVRGISGTIIGYVRKNVFDLEDLLLSDLIAQERIFVKGEQHQEELSTTMAGYYVMQAACPALVKQPSGKIVSVLASSQSRVPRLSDYKVFGENFRVGDIIMLAKHGPIGFMEGGRALEHVGLVTHVEDDEVWVTEVSPSEGPRQAAFVDARFLGAWLRFLQELGPPFLRKPLYYRPDIARIYRFRGAASTQTAPDSPLLPSEVFHRGRQLLQTGKSKSKGGKIHKGKGEKVEGKGNKEAEAEGHGVHEKTHATDNGDNYVDSVTGSPASHVENAADEITHTSLNPTTGSESNIVSASDNAGNAHMNEENSLSSIPMQARAPSLNILSSENSNLNFNGHFGSTFPSQDLPEISLPELPLRGRVVMSVLRGGFGSGRRLTSHFSPLSLSPLPTFSSSALSSSSPSSLENSFVSSNQASLLSLNPSLSSSLSSSSSLPPFSSPLSSASSSSNNNNFESTALGTAAFRNPSVQAQGVTGGFLVAVNDATVRVLPTAFTWDMARVGLKGEFFTFGHNAMSRMLWVGEEGVLGQKDPSGRADAQGASFRLLPGSTPGSYFILAREGHMVVATSAGQLVVKRGASLDPGDSALFGISCAGVCSGGSLLQKRIQRIALVWDQGERKTAYIKSFSPFDTRPTHTWESLKWTHGTPNCKLDMNITPSELLPYSALRDEKEHLDSMVNPSPFVRDERIDKWQSPFYDVHYVLKIWQAALGLAGSALSLPFIAFNCDPGTAASLLEQLGWESFEVEGLMYSEAKDILSARLSRHQIDHVSKLMEGRTNTDFQVLKSTFLRLSTRDRETLQNVWTDIQKMDGFDFDMDKSLERELQSSLRALIKETQQRQLNALLDTNSAASNGDPPLLKCRCDVAFLEQSSRCPLCPDNQNVGFLEQENERSEEQREPPPSRPRRLPKHERLVRIDQAIGKQTLTPIMDLKP